MTIARILSGFGLTAMAAPVFAHGEHGSMMVTQLLGHGFSGEHLLVARVLRRFLLLHWFA